MQTQIGLSNTYIPHASGWINNFYIGFPKGYHKAKEEMSTEEYSCRYI